MMLHAKIITTSTGDIRVHMDGGLDYESSVPLREELQSLIKSNPNREVTLDMNNVDFVGSSGISLFVETLSELGQMSPKFKLANVKEEFIRVFQLYKLDAMDRMIVDFDSDDTTHLNTLYGARLRTFEQ